MKTKQKIDRIVFWEPTLSPHKSYFWDALAYGNPGVDIVVVAHESLPLDRASMGWSINNSGLYDVFVSPSVEVMEKVLKERPNSTFHVFSGIRHYKCIEYGLSVVLRENMFFSIMSEPRVSAGFKGFLRFVQSVLFERLIRRRVKAVFAIGRNGPIWFRSVLYSSELIYPFAYFLPESTEDVVCSDRVSYNLAFVGRLVDQKGVNFLIDSLCYVRDLSVVLWVVGDGPAAESLRKQASDLGLDVRFLGFLAMDEINKFFGNIDLLVLPSIAKDGWGAVVSEALLNGVAVITTPHVGASIVIDKPFLGRVVDSKSPLQIANGIREMIDGRQFSLDERNRRRLWANRCLSADAGAKYFMKVIDNLFGAGDKPKDFWTVG